MTCAWKNCPSANMPGSPYCGKHDETVEARRQGMARTREVRRAAGIVPPRKTHPQPRPNPNANLNPDAQRALAREAIHAALAMRPGRKIPPVSRPWQRKGGTDA